MNKKLISIALLVAFLVPFVPQTRAYCVACGASAGAIAGGVVGGVAAIAIIAGLVHHHHKKQRAEGTRVDKKSHRQQKKVAKTIVEQPAPLVERTAVTA